MAPKTFFDLPAEVRNIIYHLAIEKRTAAKPKFGVKRDQTAIKPGQVLRVSKPFNIEAAPFVYGTRTFAFSCIFNAVCFLMSIGKSYSALLTSIDVGSFSYKEHETTGLHWVLRCDFEDALAATSTLLAQRCPRLRYVRLSGQRYQPGTSLTRQTAQLEGFESLASAFPRLSNVSWVAGVSVHLTVPDIPRPAKAKILHIARDVRALKEEMTRKNEVKRQKDLRRLAKTKAKLAKTATAAAFAAASSAEHTTTTTLLQVVSIVCQHRQPRHSSPAGQPSVANQSLPVAWVHARKRKATP